MTMPSGDSPQAAQDYYDYLLAHHQNDGRTATWHVDWVSLAWMWGFVAGDDPARDPLGLAVPNDP